MKLELLAPAGNFAMLKAAVNAGADAVYFGIKGLNMRESSKNFTISDLKKIGQEPVKTYLALNTVVYDEELPKIKKVIQAAKKNKIDAIICWDLAVVKLAKKAGMEVHLSTQASASNSEAITTYQKLGIKRFILARELSLNQIKKIKKNTNAEIETFVHGAMCMAVSGRCFLSEDMFGRSANRGKCVQPCRRSYIVKDSENDKSLQVKNHYIFSAKDLCTLPFIDKLIKAKISSFKIEGRSKTPEYVDTVVRVYRKAIDAYFETKLTDDLKKQLMEELKQSYNRGFSQGFYLGTPTTNDWSKTQGNVSKTIKKEIGKVINYYKKHNVAVIKILSSEIKLDDNLMFQGNKTGNVNLKISSMQIEHKEVKKAKKGDLVTIKTKKVIRENDKVFLIRNK
ncbi:MAG: U32 family peptidase [archaeon]